MKRTAQMVTLDDMDLEDFLLVALDRGLATASELDRFAHDWRRDYENAEPGSGDEKTIDNWVVALSVGACWAISLSPTASPATHESTGQMFACP